METKDHNLGELAPWQIALAGIGPLILIIVIYVVHKNCYRHNRTAPSPTSQPPTLSYGVQTRVFGSSRGWLMCIQFAVKIKFWLKTQLIIPEWISISSILAISGLIFRKIKSITSVMTTAGVIAWIAMNKSLYGLLQFSL